VQKAWGKTGIFDGIPTMLDDKHDLAKDTKTYRVEIPNGTLL
jgi:hypothetical protein